MIDYVVQRWEERRAQVEAALAAAMPEQYEDLVRAVFEVLYPVRKDCDDGDEDVEYGKPLPHPGRIACMDWGDYQGTLLFVIGAQGYQPSEYFFVRVHYGSCSGCDTLQDISDRGPYDAPVPTAEQVRLLMVLALHVVQQTKLLPKEDD